MTAPRTLLLASAAALVSVPAWAAAGAASPGHGHGATGTAPGQTKDADEHGSGHSSPTGGHPGKSHKCKPHGVAFVLTGTLEKQTLVKNADGTYSGEVELSAITHANHHAKQVKAPFKETVKNVRVVFSDLTDINSDGSVGIDDAVKGDRAKLIGKITTLAKKCDHTGFEAKITIRQVIFSAPSSP